MARNYKELEIWKKGILIVEQVYLLSKRFPKNELYGLVSQIRRCAVSLPSNIADGCGRQYDKEFKQFISIALGSCYELETQILISRNLKYVNEDDILGLLDDVDHFRRMGLNFLKQI